MFMELVEAFWGKVATAVTFLFIGFFIEVYYVASFVLIDIICAEVSALDQKFNIFPIIVAVLLAYALIATLLFILRYMINRMGRV